MPRNDGGNPSEPAVSIRPLPYSVSGVVAHGDKRGRQIGYPTANLQIDHGCELPFGIYLSETFLRIGSNRQGFLSVSSLGTRPTFNGNDVRLETHILDFDRDIYGQEIDVVLFQHIRAEIRFATVDDLILAIGNDVAEVRRRVASHTENVLSQGFPALW